MKIILKTKNLKLTPFLKSYLNEKINSLEKFLETPPSKQKKINTYGTEGGAKAGAWLEIERTTLHHRTGKIFRAECQFHLPKKIIRAEAQSEDLKIAVNELKDKLQRELKEYKSKLIERRKEEEEA